MQTKIDLSDGNINIKTLRMEEWICWIFLGESFKIDARFLNFCNEKIYKNHNAKSLIKLGIIKVTDMDIVSYKSNIKFFPWGLQTRLRELKILFRKP